ncbi:hypothetical protein BDR26DRAFT_1003315 [Obelidium mucronatum]|nr:hypothetical protein BDR26DRAFT_1003315 [Obelidium mucronatum]
MLRHLLSPRTQQRCGRCAVSTVAAKKETAASIVAHAQADLDRLSGPSFRLPTLGRAPRLAPAPASGGDELAAALFPRSSARIVAAVGPSAAQLAPADAAAAGAAPRSNTVSAEDAAFFINERFSLIYACLNTADCKRAEILFHRTIRILKNSFSLDQNGPKNCIGGGLVLERGMINAFVEAYLNESPPNYTKAFEWHLLAKEYQLAPDITTYAALIHHKLISENNLNDSAKLVLEMKADGLEPAALFGDRRFTELEDCATLSAMIRSIQGLDVDLSKVENDMRLSEMILKSAKAGLNESKNVNDTNSSDSLVLSAIQDSSSPAVSSETPTDSTEDRIEPKPSDLVDGSMAEKLKLQALLEEKALSAAVEEMAASHEKLPENLKSIAHLPSQYMTTWNRLLIPAIKTEIERLEAETKRCRSSTASSPLLKVHGGETLLVDGGAGQAVSTANVLSRIGSAIETEHNLQNLKKKKNKKMLETQMGIHNLHIQWPTLQCLLCEKLSPNWRTRRLPKTPKKIGLPEWPATTKVRAGSVLAILLLQLAKVKVPHPDPKNPRKDIMCEESAFQHDYTFYKNKKTGIIKMHPYILEKLSSDPVHVHPRLLPMVVPPRPWLTRNSGGYLKYQSNVLRTRSSEHIAYLAAADERQHLSAVYESLDVLGKTPWRVNEKVYEVMKTIWNSGEALADFPPVEDENAKDLAPKKPENWDTLSGKEKRDWVLESQKFEAKRRNNFSQRCDINYKIEIARSFMGQTIYFPHNLDFRGRAYPMPAHLNHMGNDFCRGLLMFGTKKPLGEKGLRWLKIQVANLMGNNKISFAERAQYAEDHIDDIMDSADNPLKGKRWWLTAEDPWQMLATCFELTEALRSPNPLEFCSSVAVHQDGTCNGLQHYAALGGDHLGAAQVNLAPSEKPGDIYTAVAVRVSDAVDKLAAEGECEASRLMKGKITRKLVKQTVMTNTYGVTFVGARAQVTSRIKEQPELYPFTDEQIKLCSLKITHLIFDSLGELFGGARALQNWLNSTASMIAKSIPAASIPKIQLDDAEALSKLGCLPSAFTVARAEVSSAKARERSVEGSAAKQDVSEMTMEQFNKQLLDTILDEELESEISDKGMFGLEEDTIVMSKEAEAAIAAVDSAAIVAESAKKVEKMASVIWTTPIGLPVVQPYRAIKTKTVATNLQTVAIQDHSVQQPVNPMKQSTAFPPNFIHSLDATHMMLSAIACNHAGIEFASVHDSYWTHACDVDIMAAVLRDTFVTLHSRDIMVNLRKELQDRNESHKFPVTVEISDPVQLKKWADHLKATGRGASAKRLKSTKKISTWVDLEIPPLPAKGDFDIENVRNSPYFFH